jgi:hypothetical protein
MVAAIPRNTAAAILAGDQLDAFQKSVAVAGVEEEV